MREWSWGVSPFPTRDLALFCALFSHDVALQIEYVAEIRCFACVDERDVCVRANRCQPLFRKIPSLGHGESRASQAFLKRSTVPLSLPGHAKTISVFAVAHRSFHPLISHPYPALLLVCALGANALYSANSAVVQLTDDSFNKKVLQSDSIWLVEFYAPWYVTPLGIRDENLLKLSMVAARDGPWMSRGSSSPPSEIRGFDEVCGPPRCVAHEKGGCSLPRGGHTVLYDTYIARNSGAEHSG